MHQIALMQIQRLTHCRGLEVHFARPSATAGWRATFNVMIEPSRLSNMIHLLLHETQPGHSSLKSKLQTEAAIFSETDPGQLRPA